MEESGAPIGRPGRPSLGHEGHSGRIDRCDACRLRRWREDLGLTQQQAARQIPGRGRANGIPLRTYHRWERGEAPVPGYVIRWLAHSNDEEPLFHMRAAIDGLLRTCARYEREGGLAESTSRGIEAQFRIVMNVSAKKDADILPALLVLSPGLHALEAAARKSRIRLQPETIAALRALKRWEAGEMILSMGPP